MTRFRTRIQWVDCAKGIAMLLVIVGHTVEQPLIRGLIFSFHMPLFFMLSGYTSKFVDTKEAFLNRLKRSAVSLLVPAYVLYLVRLPLLMLRDGTHDLAVQILLTMLFSSGSSTSLLGIKVPVFGMMWFLVVLFWMRTLYDLLHLLCRHNVHMLIAVSIIGLLGVGVSKIHVLPFSFDLTLAVLPFYGLGQKLKEVPAEWIRWYHDVIFFVLWLGTFGLVFLIKGQYLELAVRSYPLFPICLLTAAAGSISVCCLSRRLEKTGLLHTFFCYIGRHSIWLFVIHTLDSIWYTCLLELCEANLYLALLVRLVVDLLLLYLYAKFRSRLTVD